MSLETPIPFSEHIVFVDEIGDHGMAGIVKLPLKMRRTSGKSQKPSADRTFPVRLTDKLAEFC
jgi:hypothetical protein